MSNNVTTTAPASLPDGFFHGLQAIADVSSAGYLPRLVFRHTTGNWELSSYTVGSGTESITLPKSTRCAVNLSSLKRGWRRWPENGGAPEDRFYTPNDFSKQTPPENEAAWPEGARWKDAYNIYFCVQIPEGKVAPCIFTTSTKGGVNMMDYIVQKCVARTRTSPAEYNPVILLSATAGFSPDKAKLYYPQGEITSWLTPEQVNSIFAHAENSDTPEAELTETASADTSPEDVYTPPSEKPARSAKTRPGNPASLNKARTHPKSDANQPSQRFDTPDKGVDTDDLDEVLPF